MRKTAMLVGIPVAVLGVAVAVAVIKYGTGSKPSDKFADDLQQAQAAGLELAQSQGSAKYALTEIAPESKPQPSKTIKHGNGPKAIRSKTPSVKASPEPVASDAVEETPSTQVTETAAPTPAPAPTPVVPQTTEPDQGPILAGGAGRGRAGNDGGIGIGGILGAILRGGVGDGDNCDPHPNGGARRGGGAPVYWPSPSNGGSTIRPGLPTNGIPSGGPIGSRRRGGR